jgi:hypothetical protein
VPDGGDVGGEHGGHAVLHFPGAPGMLGSHARRGVPLLQMRGLVDRDPGPDQVATGVLPASRRPVPAAPRAGPSSPAHRTAAGPASGPSPHARPPPPGSSNSPAPPATAPARTRTLPPRCGAAPSPRPEPP